MSGRPPADDGSGELFVFIPGLMGAGILLSGAILIADGVRRLIPNRGVRRQVAVARAVRGVVSRVARSVGYEIPEPDPLRRTFRSRWGYLAAGAVAASVGGVAIRAGLDAFLGPGTLHGNPWAIGLGVGGGGLVELGSALLFLLALFHRRSPRPLRRLVASTGLGRLEPPPTDPRERARKLAPPLDDGGGA